MSFCWREIARKNRTFYGFLHECPSRLFYLRATSELDSFVNQWVFRSLEEKIRN